MARNDDRVFVKNPFRHYRKTYNLNEAYAGIPILVGLALIAGWVGYKGQHPDPGLTALDVMITGTPALVVDRGPLPGDLTLQGWSAGDVRIFDPSDVYKKINGRAGFYKSFGFERLIFVSLQTKTGERRFVDIELFDLGKSVNALGAYNGERDKDATPTVGAQGLSHISRNALYLTRGQYYLRAVGSDESAPVLAQLDHLRSRFEADLEGEALPWAYSLFLGRLKLNPDKIAYFAENAFGFSEFASDVNVGRIDEETELFVKFTASDAEAQAIAEQFNSGFASYGAVVAEGFVEDQYIQTLSKATQLERWVYGVRAARDVATAKAGLERMRAALTDFALPQAVAAPLPKPEPSEPAETYEPEEQ